MGKFYRSSNIGNPTIVKQQDAVQPPIVEPQIIEIIKEVPVEVEKIVYVDKYIETQVFVDKPYEVIKEVQVPVQVKVEIPVEVEKVVYVDKPYEVVKEVSVEVEKIVNVVSYKIPNWAYIIFGFESISLLFLLFK